MTDSIASNPVRCATPIALLELPGAIVPKARPRFSQNGRAYTHRGYYQWKQMASGILGQQWGDRPTLEGPVEVVITLSGRHRRSGDSDNIAGSILDAAVQAGILKNDNLVVIPKLSIELHYSQRPPAATILIKAIE